MSKILVDANEDRQCTATRKVDNVRCSRPAVRGTHVCFLHGGNAPLATAQARQRLMCLVEPAFEMLLKAMESTDIRAGVKAAEIILDRAGMHAKLAVEVIGSSNLANMSRQELADRASELAERARIAAAATSIAEAEEMVQKSHHVN